MMFRSFSRVLNPFSIRCHEVGTVSNARVLLLPLNIFYPEGSGQTYTVSEKAVQNGLTVN